MTKRMSTNLQRVSSKICVTIRERLSFDIVVCYLTGLWSLLCEDVCTVISGKHYLIFNGLSRLLDPLLLSFYKIHVSQLIFTYVVTASCAHDTHFDMHNLTCPFIPGYFHGTILFMVSEQLQCSRVM